MEIGDWPEPIRTLRGYLPTEMRVLRGLLGALGGVVLLVGVFVVLLGGSWHMGYGDDRILTLIFGLWISAAVGIASPLWYWVGRPLWNWGDRPGNHLIQPLQKTRFLTGLLGSIIGLTLILPVRATSGFWIQTLAPFGIAIGIANPLWFWILRPVAIPRTDAWLPVRIRENPLAATGVRILAIVAVLFVVSMAVTAVIALPIAGLGDPVTADGVTVTITDTRIVPEVTEIERGENHGQHAWRLLLVRIDIENNGDTQRRLPGSSIGDIAVVAPECSAQNFGEPSHNCNQVYLDGEFTANGTEYMNYDDQQASVDGTIGPGDRITGWLVFRIENQPRRSPEFPPTVIVDNIGRWTLNDEYTPRATP